MPPGPEKSISEDDDIGEGEADDVIVEEPDELTLALTRDITECFAIFDKNNNKTMDSKYLQKALQSLGVNVSRMELHDTGDYIEPLEGTIDFDQFKIYALERMLRIDEIDSVGIAFKTFDPENEGLVPVNRFKKWMATLGDPLTDKEIKELIKMGDPAGKGFIMYDDLIGKLCTPF